MTRSLLRPCVEGSLRPGLLVTSVVAVVLGILGMHGVDAHGVTIHGSMAQGEVGHTTTHATSGADGRAVGQAPVSASSSADDDSGTGGDGGTGGMVMWCVAMLASAAVALLAVLVRRARLPRVWAILAPAGRVRVAMPAVLRVGAGPPSVWRFSVIRC